ncbi:hypothetical protein AUR04nite_26090 [Glutamicibacter uratoxydans]|uniref:Cobalamin-independent methionine synthase MetE C-terminal/archaeal domain-containing protein n=1 Tax=Glutamicibacter uratoxydans TaxID=43667 RepID=A0A4Y4DR30_GLUUR|nr:hypothetical protein [Glutamicibacter uratoxydans]GED07077.1 hypothetical protein AUR04nite_26090 [Glutamicibacter uratoxydans]
MPDSSTASQVGPHAGVHATAFCHFPGTDPVEIHKVIRGELGEPNLAVFPQLAQRGVGADPLGRSAALVADMGFDLQPHGWRIAVPDGIDARRARSLLRSDENLLADIAGAEKKHPERLKTTVTGPYTLAAGLYLSGGERVLSDYGARRDVIEAYAHGVAAQIQRLAKSTTIKHFTIQLDEPMLPAVLDGTVPTASGYRTLRSVPRSEVRAGYQQFTQILEDALGSDAAHLVANLPSQDEQLVERIDILHQAGIRGWVIDPAGLGHRQWERIAGLVEAEGQIFLQVLEPGGKAPGVVDGVNTILRPWRQLGLSLHRLGQLTLMPRGSFAESSAAQVIQTLGHITGYAQALEQTRVDA